MAIPFSNIPPGIRVPLFYVELDPSQANTASVQQRTLIIGQMTSAGTANQNELVRCQSLSRARNLAGPGSLLADMVEAYLANDPAGELWLLPLQDVGSGSGGVAGTGNIAFTGPATASGALSAYIGGDLVTVGVNVAQTAAQIATAVAAAINAVATLAVTAAVDATNTYQVNLTARNKGIAGNDIDIRFNYQGGAEQLPAGVGQTVTAMAGGATNPPLTTALGNLSEQSFDFIVSPYTDASSIASISALLNDTTGRWSWATQVYGHCFSAKSASQGSLASFGVGLNDQHLTVLGVNGSPSPPWQWAAAMAGAAAVSLRIDPARPLQTLQLRGLLAPKPSALFTLAQRDVLLHDGISTFRGDRNGSVYLENVITTYQLNALGQVDNSYLEIETMFTLMAVLRRMASVIAQKYARVKLAASGTRIPPGSSIVTPNIIRADLIAQFRQMEEEDGWVQNADAFAAGLVVEKDIANPNRVNVLWPGALINQLRIFAMLAQFRLS